MRYIDKKNFIYCYAKKLVSFINTSKMRSRATNNFYITTCTQTRFIFKTTFKKYVMDNNPTK